MDKITKKQRSWNMSRIKGRDTLPEKIARKFLSGLNYKYRLHDKKLPGKPDIVIKEGKKVIFINGCFWHQHKGCKRLAMPKTNRSYWKNKLRRNVEKQGEDIKKLKRIGWKVKIVWECEARKPGKLTKRLKNFL